MDALQNIKGIKQLQNLLVCSSTQIRCDRNKRIHELFNTTIKPNTDNVEDKLYERIIKSLSKVYRNKLIDIDEYAGQIEKIMKNPNGVSLDTIAEEPVKPQMVASPHPVVSTKIDAEKTSPSSSVSPVRPPPSPAKKKVRTKKANVSTTH